MNLKTVLFLSISILIHYAIFTGIAFTLAVFLPPDIIIFSTFLIPISSFTSGIVHSLIIDKFIMSPTARLKKKCLIGTALLNTLILCLMLHSIISGYTTPSEAIAFSTILLVIGLFLMMKLWWTRSRKA